MSDTYCDGDKKYKAFARIPGQPKPIPLMFADGQRKQGQLNLLSKNLGATVAGTNPGMFKVAPVVVNGVSYIPDPEKIGAHNCQTSMMFGNKRVFDYVASTGGKRRTRRRHNKRRRTLRGRKSGKKRHTSRGRKTCKKRH